MALLTHILQFKLLIEIHTARPYCRVHSKRSTMCRRKFTLGKFPKKNYVNHIKNYFNQLRHYTL